MKKFRQLFSGKTEEITPLIASELVRTAAKDRWDGWLYIFWGSVAMLMLTLVWAANFELEEITTGSARIIPSSREQILQSLEGGILQDLLVHEGDTVEKGQIVARIDPTRAAASFRESANRMLALKAQSERLDAEILGKATLTFTAEIQPHEELVKRETEAWRVRRRALEESLAGYLKSQKLLEKELKMARSLAAKRLLSEAEVFKLERQANDITLQITERRNRYISEATAELTKVETELAGLEETAHGRQDTLVRTELRSPVHGVVNNVRINTLGGVIQPGAEIMSITPLNDSLLVEAKIKPSDIAFLAPGQEAVVKLSAYDYSVYGGLHGHVELISSGTLKDEENKAAARPGMDTSYYRVVVRTTNNTLTKEGSKKLEIIPGMTATVDIRTGQKSLLSYMLRPLLRVQEAFREK
ncbi:HlyD family type I secretion periplasmic adaptor subunit [Kalamiella sp. sgz302252]|uniref:HlyD family type I secretion periplasmic adaptor subunit n=1 Tax=Pantoea sp. sgz302252 TaxID=3341827 RepID=UPI0036D40120